MRTVRPPTAADLDAAAAAVAAHLVPTPVVPAPGLGPEVLLKLETLQPTGSFKVRGGVAAVAAARSAAPDGPVSLVAASAGNHGLGLAWAAGRLGAGATVVVPETASPAKVAALRQLGADLVCHGRRYDDAEAHALSLAAGGRHYVSPYNDPHVIAGQATVGRELRDQVPGLASVVVPVGGGGLASGVALSTRGAGVRVVGVEPERSTAMQAAVAAGVAVTVPVGPTMADGLAGNLEPGSVTIGLVAQLLEGLRAVSEEELAAAVRYLASVHGVVAEGAGAAAVAAVLAGKVDPGDGPTVVLVTGRNIALPLLASVLAP